MTLMELTMIPLDKGASFSKYVAQIISVIDKSGLDYQLGSMGTVVEGEFNKLLDLLSKCFELLKNDSDRISISVKFDYRKDATNRIVGKVDSVKDKL